MASPFPSESQPITPTPSCVAPELLYPPSFQESLPSSQLGRYNTADALELNLPPNAFKTIVHGRAFGRLSVLGNHYPVKPDGAGNLKLVAETTTQSKPHPTTVSASACTWVPEVESIVQSSGATLHQSPRVRVRARTRKSKAKVARGPQHTTAPRGDCTQSASQPAVTPAVQPFQWATATAEEISLLPGLGHLPVDLINLILPRLRAFVNEFESSTRRNLNSRAVQVHEQISPAERSELQPVARSLGLPLPTAQPGPSLVMQQPDPALFMAGQLCGPDESQASMPMFEELEALQQRDENVGPEPNFELPPSAVLEGQGLLDFEDSWCVEASQTSTSWTPPTQEVIERSVCALSNDLNGPSELGDGAAWGGVGMGVAAQFDFSTLDASGWEEFAKF